ncbi:MAG TPA: RNA methyltransferase [Azospirillaceae bacterium]|nr:RNA methyltransferase [Azospirillaceae bacterium]
MPTTSGDAGRLRLIESPQNGQFKLWEAVLESRGLKKHGRFILAGRKTVPEALARHPDRFQAVLVASPQQIAGWHLPPSLERYQLSRPLFDRLDVSGTGFPLLVGAVPELVTLDLGQPPRGLEVVVALGDPNNLGALLRSAAAFGVSRVILMAEAAHPFHPKCLRAAANAQFELPLCRGSAWADLNRAAGPVLALDARGDDLGGFPWPRDMRLVLGEEGQGLPPDLQARRLAIPTTGAVESLNATVAASLALFSYFLKSR